MARVCLIIDSQTGALIDVAGNVRERGRYYKFAKRMLSRDKNPVLDYGANGGDSLEVSNGGYPGKLIILKAETVEVSGDLTVNGDKISDIVSGSVDPLLDRISGADGEIVVTKTPDPDDADKMLAVISLDPSVTEKLEVIGEAMGVSGNFVKKSDVADVIRGLQVADNDDLEAVRGTLRTLLERLGQLASGDQ